MTTKRMYFTFLQLTKRTDIEFFISWVGDFVIECKNLSSAESRYIKEGLHRFLDGFYSERDEEAA